MAADRWQEFRYITLPLLGRYIELAVLLGTIYVLQLFGEIFVATQGGPGTATTTVPYYVYQTISQSNDVGSCVGAGRAGRGRRLGHRGAVCCACWPARSAGVRKNDRSPVASAAVRRRHGAAPAGLRPGAMCCSTALTYVIALLVFFPILWTVLTGFKTEANAVALPPSLIFTPTLEHTSERAWSDANYFVVFRPLGSC